MPAIISPRKVDAMEMRSGCKKKIFLVDDHSFQREGLKLFINTEDQLEVCGEAEKAAGVIGAILESEADAVVLDISLPDGDGLDITKRLREATFGGAILVLTMHDESLYAEQILQAGANGYVTKGVDPDFVLSALYDVLAGKTVLSQEWLDKKSQMSVQGELSEAIDRLDLLTPRQFQILRLIGHGKSSAEISDELNIAPGTLDAHRSNIKETLGIDKLNELIHFAVKLFGNEK